MPGHAHSLLVPLIAATLMAGCHLTFEHSPVDLPCTQDGDCGNGELCDAESGECVAAFQPDAQEPSDLTTGDIARDTASGLDTNGDSTALPDSAADTAAPPDLAVDLGPMCTANSCVGDTCCPAIGCVDLRGEEACGSCDVQCGAGETCAGGANNLSCRCGGDRNELGPACSTDSVCCDSTCTVGDTCDCAAGEAHCDGDPYGPCAATTGGSTAACPGTSCSEILAAGLATGNGLYWVTNNGSTRQVYCDMVGDGGGWTLLMKADQGETFAYDSLHWTTPSVLNEGELSRLAGDAKYPEFNELVITDIRALWPDLVDANGLAHVWLETGIWASNPQTALDGFQQYENLGIPQESPTFDATHFSSQPDMLCPAGQEMGQYGINLNPTDLCANCATCTTCAVGGFVRWGYRFNQDACCNWSSDDAGGGIGVIFCRGARMSAGDFGNAMFASVGVDRSARVEIWGR